MITVIAAMDNAQGIGFKGRIPWHIPQDLSFFRQETLGGAVIMGRKTYESLGKPLKGRFNIVLTTQEDYRLDDDIQTAQWFSQGVYYARVAGFSRIYAIGGSRVYDAALPLADRLMLTRVLGKHECDTFFPWFDQTIWTNEAHFNLTEKAIATEYLRNKKK